MRNDYNCRASVICDMTRDDARRRKDDVECSGHWLMWWPSPASIAAQCTHTRSFDRFIWIFAHVSRMQNIIRFCQCIRYRRRHHRCSQHHRTNARSHWTTQNESNRFSISISLIFDAFLMNCFDWHRWLTWAMHNRCTNKTIFKVIRLANGESQVECMMRWLRLWSNKLE